MSIEGQGHNSTVNQGHLHRKIKTVGNFELNFLCKLLGTWK